MTDREKLVRLLENVDAETCPGLYAGEACEACSYFDSNDCLAERLADHLLANGVTEQRWIPVEERLPENEQDVLVAVMRKHYAKPEKYIRFIAKAFHTDGKHDTEHSSYVWNDCSPSFEYDEENDAYKIPEGWWESIEYGEEFQSVDDFVTHWMPLPELPKEEA